MATKKQPVAPVPVKDLVESMVFAKPEGRVRGFVTASRNTKKGTEAIARTHLLTEEPAAISLDLKRTVNIDELDEIIESLTAYSARVRELDKQD